MIENIKWAAEHIGEQNKDEKLANGYGGTQDGMLAEKLYSAQLQMRAMSADELNIVEKAISDVNDEKGLVPVCLLLIYLKLYE